MERVILFGVKLLNKRGEKTGQEALNFNASMEELKLLAQTAGAQVVGIYTQTREKPDPAYFAGKGRLTDLKLKAINLRAGTIIFDNLLKPAQQKNIEELTGLKIIDRARLILDIFAARARSTEGKLQVELAQLNYFLPRITERFGRFEQQTGGIGTRGPGEKKLEVDRRRITERITRLKKEIERLTFRRETLRKRRERNAIPVVAIAGYTNVGKSTLLNNLARPLKTAYADNKLFATLDPLTRIFRLDSGRQILLTDTVGFIRNLPHELIDAFKSTLEEISRANLVIHLIDISSENWESEREIATRTINSINPELYARKKVIEVYSKADMIPPSAARAFMRNNNGKILISAKNGMGFDTLLKEIESRLFFNDETSGMKTAEFLIPYNFIKGQFLTAISNLSIIISRKFTDEGLWLKVKSPPDSIDTIRKKLEKIKLCGTD